MWHDTSAPLGIEFGQQPRGTYFSPFRPQSRAPFALFSSVESPPNYSSAPLKNPPYSGEIIIKRIDDATSDKQSNLALGAAV